MPALKILITGGSGLLGQYLNLYLSKENEILTLYNNHPGNCVEYKSAAVDITNHGRFNEVFNEFNPDIVIHSAAYTNPVLTPGVETKYIYSLNVNATLNIARQCALANCRLIYISTDLVYAGYRGSMLKEEAKLIPASLYAETKLVAENKIRDTFDNYNILRTALLYGFGLNHSTCHFHQMFENLRGGKEVKLFTDQYRTPLALKDAGRMISELVKLDVKTQTINFGGRERVSRYRLGEVLCSVYGFDTNLLVGTLLAETENIPRVADVSLDTGLLLSLGITPAGIEESIRSL